MSLDPTLQTMPANLPPEYYKLKHQLEAAKTDDERLQLMEEMVRITPKHKGSEKVISDLRRRIAKLRNAPDKKSGARRHSHHIPKQGAGQIVLLGAPNVGKSQILASFTNAKPEVSHTPFTTREPAIGMLHYDNIQFQFIDTPPMTADYVQPEILDLARNADMLLIVVNLGGDEVLDEVEIVTSKLLAAKIVIGGNIDTSAVEETNALSVNSANKLGLIVANQNGRPKRFGAAGNHEGVLRRDLPDLSPLRRYRRRLRAFGEKQFTTSWRFCGCTRKRRVSALIETTRLCSRLAAR